MSATLDDRCAALRARGDLDFDHARAARVLRGALGALETRRRAHQRLRGAAALVAMTVLVVSGMRAGGEARTASLDGPGSASSWNGGAGVDAEMLAHTVGFGAAGHGSVPDDDAGFGLGRD